MEDLQTRKYFLQILTIIILNFDSSCTSSFKAQWITSSSLETGISVWNIISQHSNKGKALVNLINLIIKEKPNRNFKFSLSTSRYCDCNGCRIKVSTYKGEMNSSVHITFFCAMENINQRGAGLLSRNCGSVVSTLSVTDPKFNSWWKTDFLALTLFFHPNRLLRKYFYIY